LQHIDYNLQVKIRKELVAEAVQRNGKIKDVKITSVTGDIFGYRCRAQFHMARNNTAGFKKRNSCEVIEISACPVCNAGINNFIKSKKMLNNKRVTVFAPDNSAKFFDENYDRDLIDVWLKGKSLKAAVSCFFQSNISMLEKTIDLVKLFADGRIFFDLYCGVGVFGLFLAENADFLVSVEYEKKAIDIAKKNIAASDNLILEFFAEKVENFLLKWNGILPDTILLDPPRTGLSVPVKKFIVEKKIKKVLYLSCDYAALGRDLGFFVLNKYFIDNIFFLDFYPQTTHAECLSILSLE
jgi:23S rRNA (uracil1939-C5)-methyltransferase